MLTSALNPANELKPLRVNAAGELITAAVLDATGIEIPPPVGGATEAKQDTQITAFGGVTETAPATDTASSGLNGRLQRIAQRLTSLIALLPTALTGSGNLKTAVLEAIPAGTNTIGATKPAGLTAKGYQQITSLSSASALTVPANSTCALIQAETQSVRWRDDGTNPTASVGMLLAAGESIFFTGSLSALRAIEVAASAKLNISYYG